MARRVIAQNAEIDVLDEAIEDDRREDAGDLTDVLDSIRALGGSGVSVWVYQIPKSGKWGFIKELSPPIDTASLIDDLRDEYGCGDFAMRIRADGKIKTTKHFTIAEPKKGVITERPRNDDHMLPMFQMMMAQQAESARRSSEQQQASQSMMITMMTNSTQMMMGVMTAMMGASPKLPEMLAAMAALRPEPQQNGMAEALSTIKAIRELMPDSDGGGGGEDNSLMGMAKTFLPAIASAVTMAKEERDNKQTEEQARVALPPPQHNPMSEAQPEPIPGQNRLLALLREDVLYFFKRRHDPELTAEALLSILDKNNVSDADVFGLITEIQSKGEQWGEWLASQGIDIRADTPWVNLVITSLVAQYSEPDTDDNRADDIGGGINGSAPNSTENGATSP